MSEAPAISVIIPVKDGAATLGETLAAVAAQVVEARFETLVVDSGSRDGSVDVARRANARILEIAPEEFGHGRTRNFAAERKPRS